jgi:NADH:ubiquinone oxidoreductase subunit 5 (subunit L)/multisubunit Na+/H+ antiporter MnhA subunit
MLWTIGLLALGTVGIGFLEFPGLTHVFQDFVDNAVPVVAESTLRQEWLASALSVLVGLAGLLSAYALYGTRSDLPQRLARDWWPLPRVLEEKLGFDIAYDWLFYRPAALVADGGRRLVEGRLVLGGVASVGTVSRWLSQRLGRAQTGIVRTYAAGFALGLAAITIYFITQGTG